MKALLVALGMVVLLLMACGGEASPLAETDWRLVAMGEPESPIAAIGQAGEVFTGFPDVGFTATDIGGWTGCNGYGGWYSVQNSELRLTELEWTEAGCPSEELFQQEQRLQALLVTVERFEFSEERLTLYGEGGQVLIFERMFRMP